MLTTETALDQLLVLLKGFGKPMRLEISYGDGPALSHAEGICAEVRGEGHSCYAEAFAATPEAAINGALTQLREYMEAEDLVLCHVCERVHAQPECIPDSPEEDGEA